MHYLREPGSVSLRHVAICLGAGVGHGAGLVLPSHRCPRIHHWQFYHCPVVIYGITFQSSAVDRLGGPRHFVHPCGVVFFDAVELARHSGGVGAGPLWGQPHIICVLCCGCLRPCRPSFVHYTEHRRLLPASVRHHPTGWSLCRLVHSLQTAPLWDIMVLRRGPAYAVLGIAHVSTNWWPDLSFA